MNSWFVYPIRFLLGTICENPDALTPEQTVSAGLTARRVFQFACTKIPRDSSLMRSAIEAVCRTFQSDWSASDGLLRKLLSKNHLEEFGHEDMPVLAREVGRLIPIAPEFVRDLYRAAFTFDEKSTEATAMGPGRILSLTSTRRQDYDHARWQLGETFPKFLEKAPSSAIQALAVLLVKPDGHRSEAPEETFAINGSVARIKTDASSIWDAGMTHRHEAPLKMLDAFESELSRLACDPNLADARNQLISLVIQFNPWAAIWRRLLICGARNPACGKAFMDLAWSAPILTCPDTSNLAGDFVKALYPDLDGPSRERIERAIISIPQKYSADKRNLGQRIRDRLLGCIPDQLVSSSEARLLLAEIKSRGGPPDNGPPFQIVSSFKEHDLEDLEVRLLSDQGVPVGEPPNRELQQLTAPIRAFVHAHAETAASPFEVQEVMTPLRLLYHGLQNALAGGAHPEQIDRAWEHIFGLCVCIVRCEHAECSGADGAFVRRLLLAGARHPKPLPNERRVADFDKNPSWSPAPRIDAAKGLMLLGSKPSCVNSEIIGEIQKLAVDPVPAVRLQIADHLARLNKTAPETMREILSSMVKNDQSSIVLRAVLNRSLGALMEEDPESVCRLAEIAFRRTDRDADNGAQFHPACASIFLFLFLRKDNPESGRLVREIAGNAHIHSGEAAQIITEIRADLTAGPVETPDPASEMVRGKVFECLSLIATSAASGLKFLQDNHRGAEFSTWPTTDQQKLRTIAKLPDTIASQLYFASGAFNAKPNVSPREERTLSLGQKQRLLREAGPLIDSLSINAHPATVHHLLEMLEYLIDVNPREVFLRIVHLVKSGKPGGYHYESLADDLAVKVVNRVLAEFRPMLQEDRDCGKAMIAMLDVFVEAGWPQALQLTYRLDEIFR